MELAPVPGEIVGVVDMPWSGDAYVNLDTTKQSAKTDEHGRFVFRGVEPGGHLLRTRASGYQPQQDSIVVPAQGAVVRIQPRTLAVCLL